jgi:hypothetical protein
VGLADDVVNTVQLCAALTRAEKMNREKKQKEKRRSRMPRIVDFFLRTSGKNNKALSTKPQMELSVEQIFASDHATVSRYMADHPECIEEAVHDYLLSHPGSARDALKTCLWILCGGA